LRAFRGPELPPSLQALSSNIQKNSYSISIRLKFASRALHFSAAVLNKLQADLGHVVDVNSKSATKDYGKIFSARAPYT